MQNLPSDDFRVSIPDDNFQYYLYNKEGIIVSEGTVAYGDIKGISKVSMYYKHILDLEGIQYFTALTSLDCDKNQLTSLDVSKNTALTTLMCDYNQLRSLDVSGASALTDLICMNNKLTSLDVSKNIALTDLYCGKNQLTSLDLSKNTALTFLYCDNNKFDCTALKSKYGITER